ncbi:hypothetical protein ACOZ4I_12995 [Haloarcula salina]|uniref:hypothetical protein n=1 Tax=Haloarcula salina TaxID=1429914 RepID=UPI003C6F8EF2
MKRIGSTLLVGLLLVSTVSSAVGVASAANVSIQSVETSVDQPAPGEAFTVTTTVVNLESSSGPADVTDVYVRRASGSGELARIEDVGTIAAGGSIDIPLTLDINKTGGQRLQVNVVVKDGGGYRRVQYPLYVDVQEPDEASISVSTPEDLVAGQESPVNVTVSNGDDGTLSNVRLELGGDGAIENPERVSAAIQSGSQVSHAFDMTFAEAGEQTISATLTYNVNGTTRTIDREVTVGVEEANTDAELTATSTTVNGSSAIEATLTEFGNVELRDGQVSAVVDGDVVTRTLVSDVGAEETQTVTLDGDDIPAGEVTVVAQYTAAGEQQTAETTVDYSPLEQSNVTLTGVEVTRQGTTITLDGDASNIGSADASSVLVSVVESEGVTPAAPNGEYFVGSVESSEFATFELTASAGANASVDSVPVRISYSAAGERVERIVEVDVSDTSGGAAAAASAANGPSGGGAPGGSDSGLPLTTIGIGVAVLVLGGVGFAAYRWRQQ